MGIARLLAIKAEPVILSTIVLLLGVTLFKGDMIIYFFYPWASAGGIRSLQTLRLIVLALQLVFATGAVLRLQDKRRQPSVALAGYTYLAIVTGGAASAYGWYNIDGLLKDLAFQG